MAESQSLLKTFFSPRSAATFGSMSTDPNFARNSSSQLNQINQQERDDVLLAEEREREAEKEARGIRDSIIDKLIDQGLSTLNNDKTPEAAKEGIRDNISKMMKRRAGVDLNVDGALSGIGTRKKDTGVDLEEIKFLLPRLTSESAQAVMAVFGQNPDVDRAVIYKLAKMKSTEPKRDIRTVGGSLIEVPEEGDVKVLHSDKKGKAEKVSSLARSESELIGLEARLAADPDNETLRGQTERARASVAKISGLAAADKVTDKKEEDASAFSGARAAITKVTELLDAGDTFGPIAGFSGAAKATLGGAARQAGIPISTQSRQLNKQLEVLQAAIGPKLLSDSRLSNEERARVATIVGSLDGLTDETDIRSNMAELENILRIIEGRDPEGTPGAEDTTGTEGRRGRNAAGGNSGSTPTPEQQQRLDVLRSQQSGR